MNKQLLQAHRLAGAAKRKGALEATICCEHGPNLVVVHVEMFDGSARSEIVRRCGCIDIEIHRPGEGSAAIESDINLHPGPGHEGLVDQGREHGV